MIKYNLICSNKHEFESWFSNSAEFDKLKEKEFLECIYCSSKKINKSIMAPRVSNMKNKQKQNDQIDKNLKDERSHLLKLRNYIEKNFDYVGEDFSKKVREVYYDKKSKKAIYGTTTAEERKELEEEGIDLLSIPWVNKDN
tara:strand:+ start:5411 stop:5833 length:423 start_codon:yes stop_codon:yes gene_type:complete